MRDTINFEELVEMPFFEGLAAVSLISRGDLNLIVGGRSAQRSQIKKMVEDIVRIMTGKETVALMN
jgi:hypothetical protein